MVDLRALDAVLSTRNGVWATFLVVVLMAWRGWQYVPAIVSAWVDRRKAIAAEKDADWSRRSEEITRLAARVDLLEHREEACQEQLRAALGRLSVVEGYMTGQGMARQQAAGTVALERADPSKATTSVERFNGEKGEGK